jgi:hypothetical protein
MCIHPTYFLSFNTFIIFGGAQNMELTLVQFAPRREIGKQWNEAEVELYFRILQH